MEWNEFGEKSMRFICNPIERDSRITILEGSVRSSKTVTMIPKWLNYIQNGPSGLLAMTGVSKQTLKTNVLNDLFDTVGRKNYSYNKQTGELCMFGRNILVIGVKDEGSEKYLRGSTFAGAYADELVTMPESAFTQLLNRLSVEGSKLYGTTNPDSPYHYLHKDYIADAAKQQAGMVTSIHFELDDNPSLSDEYKNFIKKAYAGLWYKRMILGQWVMAEGAIYDMFDDAINVIDFKELPKSFERKTIACDYGAGNPTVFLKIGWNHNKQNEPVAWIYDEYYYDPSTQGSKTTSQYKADFVKFMGGETFDAIYPDPSALDFINELKSDSCGGPVRNIKWAKNEVLPGINTVSTFISAGRLFIVRQRCPHTLLETASYIWDASKQLKGIDEPLKQNDHCLDPIRYNLHTEHPATLYKRVFV